MATTERVLTPIEKIRKAMTGLILDQPFFGSLALHMELIPDYKRKTAITNGDQLWFNPDFIDTLTLSQTKFVIAHEVMHKACNHGLRMKGRDNKKWNVAGDYVINGILKESGFDLIEGAYLNNAYDGMSAEQVYSLLPEGNKDSQSNSSDQSQPPGITGSQGSQDQQDPQNDQQDQQNDQQDDEDPGGCGAVCENPNISPQEAKNKEQDMQVAVVQAAQQARACGKFPAGLKCFVESLIEPKKNWREVLRRFVDQAAKNDYSWQQPNRRYIGTGFYLPSLNSRDLGPIVCAIDTSGSIDDEMLNKFSAELQSIMQEFKTSCHIVYCDTKIHSHGGTEFFTSEDVPFKMTPVGGGGTNFKPPFKWLEDQGITPSCMIYWTDMQSYDFPEEEPPCPLIWAETGDKRWRSEPPFGERIDLEES